MSEAQAPNTFIPPEPSELSQHFPGYQIIRLIACGGMGAVYEAIQVSLERAVAIKILPREFTADESFREGFQSEAKAMAKLNHPNLISVYDFGEVDGMLYIIMEYVAGPSLFQAAQSQNLQPSEIAILLAGVSKGLAHAHENGIIHRDIKPANIILDTQNQPKIGDFGLARPSDRTVKDGEEIFGTPGYTAPEVIENPQQIDHRADIFSLGVMIHELLTGQLPDADPRPPSAIVMCDSRFDALVRKATQHQSALRYNTANEIALELESIAASGGRRMLQTGTSQQRNPSSITPHHPAKPVYIPPKKSSSGGLLIAALIITGTAIIGLIVMNSGSKRESSKKIVEQNPLPIAPSPQDNHNSTQTKTTEPKTDPKPVAPDPYRNNTNRNDREIDRENITENHQKPSPNPSTSPHRIIELDDGSTVINWNGAESQWNIDRDGGIECSVVSLDISNKKDHGAFRHSPWSGDGIFTLVSPEFIRAHESAIAGIMLRESTEDDSRFFFLTTSPNKGTRLFIRESTGGNTTLVASTQAQVSHLRIHRYDNAFYAQFSKDGESWQNLGEPYSQENLKSTIHVGIAASSHSGNPSDPLAAKFSQCSLTRYEITPDQAASDILDFARNIMKERCTRAINDHSRAIESNAQTFQGNMRRMIRRLNSNREQSRAENRFEDLMSRIARNGNRIPNQIDPRLEMIPAFGEIINTAKDEQRNIDNKLIDAMKTEEAFYISGLETRRAALNAESNPAAAIKLTGEIQLTRENPDHFGGLMMETFPPDANDFIGNRRNVFDLN